MSEQHNNLETRLQGTLGAGQLSAAQRQNHLDRLRIRAAGPDTGTRDKQSQMFETDLLSSVGLQPHADRLPAGVAEVDAGERGNQRRLLEVGVIAAAGLIILIGIVLWSELQPSEDTAQAGVAIEDLETLTAPLEPGEARSYTLTIGSDLRIDRGMLLNWEVEVLERRLPDGTLEVSRIARDPDGEVVARFTQSGERWWWDQGGWVEAGTTSLGIIDLPEEIRVSMAEPTTALSLLTNPEDYTVIDDTLDGDRRIISYVQPKPDIREWVAQQYGEGASVAIYELVTDQDQSALFQSRSYFITEDGEETTRSSVVPFETPPVGRSIADDGEEVTLAELTINDVTLTTYDELDDSFFEFNAESAENLQYPAPQASQLPESMTLLNHRQDTLSATEWLTLSLGDVGDVIEVRVTPTHGGYDPFLYTATREDINEIQVTTTEYGNVVWSVDEQGTPRMAIWDTGRFGFNISVTSDLTDPSAFGEEELFALIDALSKAGDADE